MAPKASMCGIDDFPSAPGSGQIGGDGDLRTRSTSAPESAARSSASCPSRAHAHAASFRRKRPRACQPLIHGSIP